MCVSKFLQTYFPQTTLWAGRSCFLRSCHLRLARSISQHLEPRWTGWPAYCPE